MERSDAWESRVRAKNTKAGTKIRWEGHNITNDIWKKGKVHLEEGARATAKNDVRKRVGCHTTIT